MIEVAKEEVFVVINWTRQDEDNNKQSVALVSPTALKLTNCVQERLRQQAIKEKEKERTQFYQKQKEGQKDIRAKYREKVPSHFSQIISFRLLKWKIFFSSKLNFKRTWHDPFLKNLDFCCFILAKQCQKNVRAKYREMMLSTTANYFLNLTIYFELSQIWCCGFVIYLKQRSL